MVDFSSGIASIMHISLFQASFFIGSVFEMTGQSDF